MARADYRLYDGVKQYSLTTLHLWQAEDEDGRVLTPLAAYGCVPYVYRAVQLRSLAVASMPWVLVRERDAADVTTDPAYRSLVRGMRMRLYATEADLCLYGAAYWLKETNRMGRNLVLRRVLPPSIQPCYDPHWGLVGFERHTASGTQRLGGDEVVYIWQPSVRAEVGPGLAPIQVALAAAGVLHHLDRFAEGFFQRGAIKATLLSVEGNPAKAELDRLEHWWRRLVSGVRRAWESVAIRSTVKPVVIGEGLEALASETLTTQRREDVCAALGVPHSMIAADAANYATAQQDKITFLTTTIIPACELIAEALNEQLFQPLGLCFRFQPAQLEELQQYEVLKAQALAQLTGQPILTVDEARAMMGLPAMTSHG